MTAIIDRRWSISAARSYLACPRQFFLTRVAGVEQEVGDASFRGQLAHAALAAGYPEADRALREGRSLDVARCRAEAAAEVGIAKEADRLHIDYEDELVDTVARCLHYLGPRAGDEVLGVEYDMDIRVEEIAIGYRADLVYRRGGILVCRDWKLRRELPKARDLPRNWQLALGALCAARTFGATVVRVELASIGSAVAVAFPVTVDAAQSAGRVVAETARRAAADTEFVPLPGEACATCSVRAHCPVFGSTDLGKRFRPREIDNDLR